MRYIDDPGLVDVNEKQKIQTQCWPATFVDLAYHVVNSMSEFSVFALISIFIIVI